MPEMVTQAPREDVSGVIGELRNFAAQQQVTNQYIVDELKRISERLTSFGEVGVTLQEYRHTLHERFNRIHTNFAEHDELLERLQEKYEHLDRTITAFRVQARSILTICWVAGTIVSSLLSVYGTVVLKAIAHATP
jgi:chromosome segregation ATPase